MEKRLGTNFIFLIRRIKGFPGSSVVKNPPANAEDMGSIPPLDMEMVTHPVFLPGKSNGHRSLAGYSPWGCKVRRDLATKQ